MIDMKALRRTIDGIAGDQARVTKQWLLDVERELAMGNAARITLARERGVGAVCAEIAGMGHNAGPPVDPSFFLTGARAPDAASPQLG